MSSSGRRVYERLPLQDFQSPRIESFAVVDNGTRMFVGTADGNLSVLQCRTNNISGPDTVPTFYKCISSENVRKPVREKKPVLGLRVVQNWKVVIAIVESMVTTFDMYSCQPISQLTDTKGCTLYAVHETNSLLLVAGKRKLIVFQWNGAGFNLVREIVTVETPRTVYSLVNFVIIGYKKHYEAFNVSSFTSVKVWDVEREHRMTVLEVPACPRRAHSVVLSNSLQGLVFDVGGALLAAVGALSAGAGGSGGGGGSSAAAAPNGSLFGNAHSLPSVSPYDQRLEWQSAPLQSVCVMPYIVSLQASQIEIHHVLTLGVVQTVRLAPMIGNSMPVPAQLACAHTHLGLGSSILPPAASTYSQAYARHSVFVAQSDGIAVYPMVPLPSQIQSLVDNSVYDDALSLCSLCTADGSVDAEVLNYISVSDIHKKYAYNILQRGDYDGAISHFLLAETKFRDVLALFPEFVPKNFSKYEIYLQDSSGFAKSGAGKQSTPSRGAASALAMYCEKVRPSVKALAEKAERLRSSQQDSARGHSVLGAATFKGRKYSEDSSTLLLTLDPEELIRDAIILDTMYVSALTHCSPPRRAAIVALLCKPNYCHLDSCSLMIASQGNAYTEALLWLFRSHSDHKRVLSALSESNCCGENAWNRRQYYGWVTEYLTSLWRNSAPAPTPGTVSSLSGVSATGAGIDQDVSARLLVTQVLPVLRTVFEYDANMGLSVLVNASAKARPGVAPGDDDAPNVGGQGVPLEEILQFLNNVHKPGRDTGSPFASVTALPLTNGKAIEVAYLSWLVGTGLAAPSTHNMFIQSLVDVIAKEQAQDGSAQQVDVYRRALQEFLQTSREYDCAAAEAAIPVAYIEEQALLLSRLGRHEEVLGIYVHELQDMLLCEAYCDRVYSAACDIAMRPQPDEAAAAPPQIPSRGGVDVPNELLPSGYMTADKLFHGSRAVVSAADVGAADVYLSFVKTLIAALPGSATAGERGRRHPSITVQYVVAIAEKYHARLDPKQFLACLPAAITVKKLHRFLKMTYEHENAKMRNLQVVHQLLRVREVNVRTTLLTPSALRVGNGAGGSKK